PARGRRRMRLRRLPRPHPRLLGAVAVLVAIVVGGFFWLRDSSLVAVRGVTIVGVSGPGAGQIRAALTSAARNMTTMDVNMAALRTAVEPFPVVKHVHVSTQFPHRMRIDVAEQVPVAMISAGGRRTAVSGDGSLLQSATVTESLPTITLAISPGGSHVTGGTLSAVQLLGAAPYPLLAKISTASAGGAHGLQVQLRSGPYVYFGDGSQLTAKWAAVGAVLADSGSAGADYIDVSVPTRPVAGVGTDSASSPSPQSAGTGTVPGG
ncbi:MAG: FtsQ-type POTRA domain-containing protein, partial [Solirubrobacteraceae bacterium]